MLAVLLGLFTQIQVVGAAAGPVDLTGPWRFRAGDSVAWAAPELDDSQWDTVRVPAPWAGLVPPGYRGAGWYRLAVAVPESRAVPMGLWFQSVATAFEVYVDGERVGGIGGFPPAYRPRTVVPLVVPLPVRANAPGTHVIAVRVHSAERVGGLVGGVSLGPLQALERAAFRPDLYLVGATVLLLGIGLIQIFFWIRRPLAGEHGAIFAVCACLGLFFIFWMPSVRVALEPYVSWMRLYLAAAAASATAYCVAFRRIFELDDDRVVLGIGLAFLVQVPLFLALPGWDQVRLLASFALNPLLLLGSLVTLAIAVRQFRLGARHARILLWGTALLAATLFHDILIEYGVLATQPAFPWLTLAGAVGFVAALALTTAERFVESETAALYDRLTGLYRREVVMDSLAREIRRASRVRQPLAVIMLDVDRFKQINDTLGHQAGDRVLAEIGRRMLDAGRAVDWLGRYGGEEFIAVLAATDTAGAALAAERIRKAVSALPIATGRTGRTVTLSAGVAAYDGGEEWPTTEQLVGAADAALYRAKNAGRDRVEE